MSAATNESKTLQPDCVSCCDHIYLELEIKDVVYDSELMRGPIFEMFVRKSVIIV